MAMGGHIAVLNQPFELMIIFEDWAGAACGCRPAPMLLDQGDQVEAAKALGLTPVQRFRFIVLPQAIRTILPPLGNDFIAMIKDSSLVSVLGVADLTQMGKVYASGSFRFFETYSIVAYVYLLLTVGLSLGLRALEKRLRRSDEERGAAGRS